jgi:hypothetical protein
MRRITIATRLATMALACALSLQPVAADAAGHAGFGGGMPIGGGGFHAGVPAAGFHAGGLYAETHPAFGGVRDFGPHSRWWTDGLGLNYPYVWGADGEPDSLYYCQDPPGYYPDVTQCDSGWQSAPAD